MTFIRLFSTLILISMMLHTSHSAGCPARDAITPCSCYDRESNIDVALRCSLKDVTLSELKGVFHNLHDIENIGVELEDLNLGVVPSGFFRGNQIKQIFMSRCNLDSLSGGGGRPLEGLEISLEELTILASFTEENQPAKLTVSHLRSLREIDLSYNSITELGNAWFKNASSTLRRIKFSNNNIEVLGNRVFADVHNLEYLTLDGNRFGSLSRSMFPNPAKELDTLELSNNALISLPEDIFSNMPYLTVVTLTTNGIFHISENVWKPIWNNVDDIDLRGNPLQCDSHMQWMNQNPTCATIQGQCVSPRDKAGQDLPVIRDEYCKFVYL